MVVAIGAPDPLGVGREDAVAGVEVVPPRAIAHRAEDGRVVPA